MGDRLYRSRSDRMLAGVAGGLAEMWGADPSLVRIVWALLVFLTGGLALVVYIVMALVVPEGDPRPWPPATGAADAGWEGAGAGSPAGAGITGSGWVSPPPAVGRRAARDDGTSTVPLLFGAFLILLGGFFLAREFLPQIDFDFFWPAMLILLGVVILVNAIGGDRGNGSAGGPGASS
jgi:phage shock protein C